MAPIEPRRQGGGPDGTQISGGGGRGRGNVSPASPPLLPATAAFTTKVVVDATSTPTISSPNPATIVNEPAAEQDITHVGAPSSFRVAAKTTQGGGYYEEAAFTSHPHAGTTSTRTSVHIAVDGTSTLLPPRESRFEWHAATISREKRGIECCAVSPSGNLIAVGGRQRSVKIYSSSTASQSNPSPTVKFNLQRQDGDSGNCSSRRAAQHWECVAELHGHKGKRNSQY